MGQNAITHDVLQRRMPRRTGLFLLISNNAHYIIIVPILALILFLETKLIISIGISFVAIIGMAVFWTILNLDSSLKYVEHPHHLQWNRFKSLLSNLSHFIRQRPAWQISIAGWLLASAPIFMLTWPIIVNNPLIEVKPRLGFDLYWLAYIPVLMWISYRAIHRVSEWFGLFWLFSALFYSLCFRVIYGKFSIENIIHLSILVGWFLFLSVIIHYLFRRVAIFRGQAELLQVVTERLRSDRRYTEAFDVRPVRNEPDSVLNEIAEYIGTMLLYDRVFILVPDPEKDELFMKGRYGVKAPWPEKGWSIKKQVSITGWVALNNKEHLCPDTNKCNLFFNPNEEYSCNSEATVPILVEGECVGVIDIESKHLKAFNHSDIRLLWQIANSIGAALNYERQLAKKVNNAYQLFEDASNILVYSKNLDDALKKVTQKLRKLFDADLVVLYKHAVCTCVPLPGLIFDGEALFPELLGSSIRRDSRVNQLIQLPENLYVQPNAQSDPFLLGSNNGDYELAEAEETGNPSRFVKREKIQSMVYLKLGHGGEVVGSLFLNYRKKMNFQTQTIEALQAFANILTMGLILKRQTERAVGPLAGNTPLAHSTAEAAFESVSRDFNDIDWKQIKHIPENQILLKQIKTYKDKLEELRRKWTNLIIVEQANLHRSSMVEPITHLESKLRSMFPNVVFEWDSREFLNLPTDELGEVIYKVIAEGISNALVHAFASRISIQCRQENDSIHIFVINNGKSIDIRQAELINNLKSNALEIDSPEKQTGIIPILLDSRRWFGAEWDFSSPESNITKLAIVFPLQYLEEEEEYAYEDEV